MTVTKTRPSILIVDDVAANRLALKRLLGKFDIELIEADSGNCALAMAVKQNNIALILLDVQMPEMDGYEVAQFLREEPQTRHIPIIFVTAVHRDEQHVLKGYSSGAVDYISKPIIPEILMSKVKIFLELWQLRDDLEQANVKAQAVATAKNQFLSTMSHEIRTPMNGVLGVAELLVSTDLDPQQRQYVETILNSGELLLTILNDILDFSKLDAGKVRLEHISFNLKTVCEEVMQLLAAYGKQAQLSLLLDYPADTPSQFIGDPARIRQILFNLIGNAIKFTESGHVRLNISVTSIEHQTNQVIISVKDTGKGISAKEQHNLFQSFTQASPSIAREFGGTGLGLAICQQLAQLMNGNITVKSTLGKGSLFKVQIPLKTSAPKTLLNPNKVPYHGALPQFDRNILLVEDTKINQMVALAMLRRLGLTILLAENGQQALDHWRKQEVDLIFMDCNMPVMDGFAATDIIRNEESRSQAHIPIIALTANATHENDLRCKQSGMDDVATKPFTIADLARLLDKWLPVK